MPFVVLAGLIAGGLFLALLLVEELGRRYGRAQLARDPQTGRAGLGPIESAIFALMGLLLAFSFNGAATRFEARRALIAQESNAVSTAYLRLDLLPETPRRSLQAKFRAYLRERLAAYRMARDPQAAYVRLARADALQAEIWAEVVPAVLSVGGGVPMLVLNPVNQVFDIANTRLVATQAHPPIALYLMLGGLTLLAAFPAGHAMAQRATRPTLHMVLFAAMLAVAIFITLDLEYPRLGLIRIDEADQNLVRVLERMR